MTRRCSAGRRGEICDRSRRAWRQRKRRNEDRVCTNTVEEKNIVEQRDKSSHDQSTFKSLQYKHVNTALIINNNNPQTGDTYSFFEGDTGEVEDGWAEAGGGGREDGRGGGGSMSRDGSLLLMMVLRLPLVLAVDRVAAVESGPCSV